jgi:hypothetical protein
MHLQCTQAHGVSADAADVDVVHRPEGGARPMALMSAREGSYVCDKVQLYWATGREHHLVRAPVRIICQSPSPMHLQHVKHQVL